MNLTDGLEKWLNNVEEVAKLSTQERAEITDAGAQIYKNKLEAVTNAKHRSNHNDQKYGHMADNITSNKTNIDGQQDGTSTVGWNNPYHAANARRLNNGTKKYKADHFVTNAQEDSINEVLAAEAKVYQQKIRKAEDK
ncbi:MAG TPA: HK97 gp10 family phage protein [Ligilactobacillus acidipiscis]|uniref:HK97 gp10 family phage protein n=1 Tax=Ligilactobacillus acidipiscis TaxID=89059 RepID=A0A921F973_9LACO|nr:HK97 gp10 family phage protein [Ligilactobacillus acidipiscis]